MRSVIQPPSPNPTAGFHQPGGWWHETDEPSRIHCDLCPRACVLRPGDRGFCFVRENIAGEMILSTYGRSTGFCIDPIEKKPLNHFYPGTSVLSFGTAGCNLGCKFCQNWDISKSREVERLSEEATPATIAAAAKELGCDSVAFTYNDPVVWAEYAIDTAKACRAAGIKTVAVTAGYITPEARGPFFEYMDAANVDLKAFSEDFYKHVTLSHLQPVLDTLKWLVHESDVWLEVTNLIIPDANDTRDEVQQMCDWLLRELGADVPIHFTAFHPDFRMRDRGNTRPETLFAAYDLAKSAGLRYPYVGNIHSPAQQSTYCPNCRRPVIDRVGYEIRSYAVRNQSCAHCGAAIAGRFHDAAGTWGSRRQPVRISSYAVAEAEPKNSPEPPLLQIESSLSKRTPTMNPLTNEPGRELLQFAAKALCSCVLRQPLESTAGLPAEQAQQQVLGTFVSAKRSGQLRGCCGSLGQLTPLQQSLAHSAQRTASDDPRFPPISPSELPFLDLEVWVLSNMQPVESQGVAREGVVVIGKHGLQIARGNSRGLLLPGVAVDQGFSAEEFLRQVCRKAGLPPTAWKDHDTQLWTFEGVSYHAPLAQLSNASAPASPALSTADLRILTSFFRDNVIAAATGATPNYFAHGAADGNISGLVAKLATKDGQSLGQSCRLNLRDSLPLQSSLFQIAQQLGEQLGNQRVAEALLRDCVAELTVLTDVALHGTIDDPDLRGIDPARRALIAIQRQRTAVAFDSQATAESLLQRAIEAARIDPEEPASIFSLAAASTAQSTTWAQFPQPANGPDVRPAAQAGRFYPADVRELNALVDRCLAGESAEKQSVPAVMVPHAGLIYSGKIAADVLRRVQIPQRVIVIGPKHTPHGVDWAVAPQAAWAVPGAQLAADRELAELLCQKIPGLQLDAAAHAQEHAVEVELPFLARLAPNSKVTGIALGQATLAQCLRFATGLAEVIRSLPEPPLLIVWSDMNHFATDAENRRLDEIALQSLETLDPATLFETVRDQEISMCGLVPAVIVVETLRQLNKLQRVERIGYATSADVTGDSSRVVGYAGVLFL
ncbi:AmmeMemoRadiSam system radical SAM enzyme [Anatilimnocola floriformis]|uniref:AmmeMemoRadiSam system radical SAM enzyme n=1 Tax=Anatilimnocola floriformis TaxID=2948575 RepID=UPI0020C2E8BB|nr:AmmeMemoRadiSam system radical SAM enzyme [Anatilimnocola floriformis]